MPIRTEDKINRNGQVLGKRELLLFMELVLWGEAWHWLCHIPSHLTLSSRASWYLTDKELGSETKQLIRGHTAP